MPLIFDSEHLSKRGIIYIGTICNIRCKFCYYHSRTGKRWRPMIMNYLRLMFNRAIGMECMDITGGEPTIHPHIGKLVDFCYWLGYKEVRLITNGTRADRCRPIVAKHPDIKMSVSVHSHKAIDLSLLGQSNWYPEALFKFLQEFKSNINYVNIVPTEWNSDFENTPVEIAKLLPGKRICIKMMDMNSPNDITKSVDFKAVSEGARRLLAYDPDAQIDFRYFAMCTIDKDVRDNQRVTFCSVRGNVYDPNDWNPTGSKPIFFIHKSKTTLGKSMFYGPWQWLCFAIGSNKTKEKIAKLHAVRTIGRINDGMSCRYQPECKGCQHVDHDCDCLTDGYFAKFGREMIHPI
jgi:organic radical activating enzyme